MFPGKSAKTRGEIESNFRDAYQALRNSLKLYDEGHFAEVARIASSIYIFSYNHGKKTRSLLSLVDRKHINFLDSARPLNPKNLLTEMPMVLIRVGTSGSVFLPKLSDGAVPYSSWVSYAKWWEGSVLRDSKRRVISRKNLVTAFRNTEGGGHVAPYFEKVFADLRRNNSMGWKVVKNGEETNPTYGPEYPTIWQIGWELEETLKAHCSDLLT